MMATLWIAFGDIGAHEGAVVRTTETELEHIGYQALQPWAHASTVLCEASSREEAQATLDAWLECDSVQKGTYCYAHNPGGS